MIVWIAVVGWSLVVLFMMFVVVRSWIRTEALPPSPTSVPAVANPSEFKIGAWCGGYRQTWPLVKLGFDERALRLTAVSLPEEIAVGRDEVEAIEIVRGPMGSGLRLITRTGRLDDVVIWPTRAVRRALVDRGWPVPQDLGTSVGLGILGGRIGPPSGPTG